MKVPIPVCLALFNVAFMFFVVKQTIFQTFCW